MENVFTVQTEHLSRLSADNAVRFFARLLQAEASRVGVAATDIRISSRTNVPDGGVDAFIGGLQLGKGLLVTGPSVFQVKAGATFRPTPSAIHAELFGDKKPASRDSLSDHLRQRLDDGSRYVLVCTGIDLTDQECEDGTGNIRAALKEAGFDATDVELISINQLIRLLQPFPSVALSLNGNGNARFQTLKSWSRDDQMATDFKEGEQQSLLIEDLRKALRDARDAVHVRVLGEAGVGKTRLVLRALQQADLEPFVIYCDNPKAPEEDGLLNLLLRDDNPFFVTLVVDECDAETKAYLWNKLKLRGPKIKLVTLYNDFEARGGNTAILEVPPLDERLIVEILKGYLPPNEPAERWAGFCSGSPRMAHLLGSNLKSNPQDPLHPGDTTNAWSRIVSGGDKLDSIEVQQRRLVLRHIALFKRFGYEGANRKEGQVVADLVQRVDPAITRARFDALIATLRHRRILQGDTTLYMSPELLHIQMWKEWWETYKGGFNYQTFQAGLTEQLNAWFDEMFKYAAESAAAQGIVKELLGPTGPFHDGQLLKDPRGARFFNALTEAAPADALQRLQATLGTWSKNDLLEFSTGRRQIVWAIEKIAVWREYFGGAARLMLALAEAENETWSNNATGVFEGFFTPARAPIAPTEASPEERFPVLKEALLDASADRRKIALGALKDALQTGHFSRAVGPENQGLRRQPKLWSPKTWGELFDAYRRAWHLLEEQLDALSPQEQQEGVKILLNAARGVSAIGNLTDMVVKTLLRLLEKPYVDRREVIDTVEGIFHYDAKGFSPETRAAWEPLRKRLEPIDFHGKMERFVAMELLIDSFDNEGRHTDKVGPEIQALAEQAMVSPLLLEAEIHWLVTSKAKNGFRFGYLLGQLDPKASFLSEILRAQRNATGSPSVFFLGGYLRAIFERDADAHDRLLDELSRDPALRIRVPELSWRSGLTDRSALRVLAMAKSGDIGPESFRMFAFGGVIRDLSEGVVRQWIEYLLEVDTVESVSIALDLFHFYFVFDEPQPLPDDLTLRLLTSDRFFQNSEARGPISGAYEWNQVAKSFVKNHPQHSVTLATKMLSSFGNDDSIVGGFDSQAYESLASIFGAYPKEVWAAITGFLGPPIDSRAFRIQHWLREGPISNAPTVDFFGWIDGNVEKRAWYAATLVEPSLASPLTRELLSRYGDRDDVQRNLLANFGSGMWSGPISEHYQGRLTEMQELRQTEVDPNIIRWVDRYIDSLTRSVQIAREEEERDDF